MEIDPPTAVGADLMRRPNKMLPTQDKNYKFQQNEIGYNIWFEGKYKKETGRKNNSLKP